MAEDAAAQDDEQARQVRLAAFRGLMYDAPMKQRIAVFLYVLVFTVALNFTPAGAFTILSTPELHDGVQIFLVLIPLAAGIFLLGIPSGILLSVALGYMFLVRMSRMAVTITEAYYATALPSIVPFLIMAVVLGILLIPLHKPMANAGRGIQIVLLVIACAISSEVLVFSQFLTLAIAYPDTVGMNPLLATILAMARTDQLLEFLFCMATLLFACIPTLIVYERRRAGRWSRTMRALFRRWLLVFVSIAFICTMSVTFIYETRVAQRNAVDLLRKEAGYLEKQIDDHEDRTARVIALENDMILAKAQLAASSIEVDPSILESVDSMRELADKLGLNELNVTDSTGTLVARATDSSGIGTYRFGDYDTTKQYMAILSDPSATVIEEPRASIDASGNATDTYSQFAGVSRADGTGIVQISIPASEYQEALSAASIEHLGDDYSINDTGGIIIAENGVIITATDQSARGMAESDYLQFDDVDPTADIDTILTTYDSDTGRFETSYFTSYGAYHLLTYLPIKSIYTSRNTIMIWSTILYLVLFAVVFALASRLLSAVVIDGIQKTNRTLGKITDGDLEQKVDVHSNAEFDSLSEGINTTVGALKDSIAEANERMARELMTACAIQSSALPRTFPPFPEIIDFDIYASMNPAREVGGDFYDFFLIDDHTLGFLIADVSGKGIPAALFMMTAKTELENYIQSVDDLADAVSSVNHRLCIGNDAEMFVTAFVATLDYRTGQLTYVNAGHNPPLLRHDGTWEWIKDRSGLFLGTLDDLRYRSFTRTLEHRDELVLYTDGVTEAWSKDGVIYGEERFIDLLDKHATLHPTALVTKVKNDLAAFSEGRDQADDITLLALEYGEAPDVSDSITVPADVDQLETVLGFVHGELARRLCPIKSQKQLDIAIEELFVNIAHYAYPDATEEHPGMAQVTYTYNATPPCITVQLSDTGLPYDPLKRTDPTLPKTVEEAKIGGLGIMMAKRCVDEIDYRYEKGHNILTMTKRW